LSINDQYIIQQDFQLIPIKELSEDAKKRFSCNADDFVISSKLSRSNSQVIDCDGALLLKEFQEPKSMIDAIISFSSKKSLDAQDVLDKSYSFLNQLRRSGTLVLSDGKMPKQISPQLPINSDFLSYSISRLINIIEDTEVYEISDKNNHPFVLKIGRANGKQSLEKNFSNETNILSHIHSKYCPKLIEAGHFKNNPFLIMELVEGEHASKAANRIRRALFNNYHQDLLKLCISILEVYVDIHKQNLIHSDVHPDNILVNQMNEVKLIDFGLARFENWSDETNPRRGGIGFFFEPEYAKAVLKGLPTPPATFKGEQYAVAALLFFLFTGKHYINFSYEKSESLEQIKNQDPLSFKELDIVECEAIEKILHKALSKNPEDRYPDIKSFLLELSNAHLPSANGCNILKVPLPAAGKSINRLSPGSAIIKTGLSTAPTSSVTYGAAGIAYYFYRLSCLFDNPQLLSSSEVWIHKALANTDVETAFYNPQLEITKKTVGNISLYHSITGVLCVNALICSSMGRINLFTELINKFINAASSTSDKLDLTTGRSGLLIGCALTIESIRSNGHFNKELLIQFGNETLNSIWDEIDELKPIREDKRIEYLGIAHGWAGILYASLLWCHLSRQPVPRNLLERINQLIECRESHDTTVSWRKKLNHPAVWTGWCHGTAGYIHLWTLANRFFKEEAFNELALQSANHMNQSTNAITSNVCCGLSGQAYACLNLYKHFDDEKFLKKAIELKTDAMARVQDSNLILNSLYKGDIGLALLEADLYTPMFSAMPLFEPHGFI